MQSRKPERQVRKLADINYAISLRVSKDYLDNSIALSGATASMSNVGMKSLTVTLSTNVTSISTANLSAVGMAFLRNLQTATASTVTVGFSSGGSYLPFCEMRSGEGAMLRLAGGTDFEAKGTAEGDRLRIDITEG